MEDLPNPCLESRSFTFNDVTYEVTSSYRATSDPARRMGILFSFSLAIIDSFTGKRQISLNKLSLVKKFDKRKKKMFLAVNSPLFYGESNCKAIVFIPGIHEPEQNKDRESFIRMLHRHLETVSSQHEEKVFTI